MSIIANRGAKTRTANTSNAGVFPITPSSERLSVFK